MRKIIFPLIISSCVFIGACQKESPKESPLSGSEGSSSWSYSNMIVFKGTTYLGTDETIQEGDVGELMGQIKYSSDHEEEVKEDSFSNTYPVGTSLYKIKNVREEEAIAVEIKKETFIKAVKK